jgi:hypothetical protein
MKTASECFKGDFTAGSKLYIARAGTLVASPVFIEFVPKQHNDASVELVLMPLNKQ